ncbi:MAG: tandem-95 repeat protein, partial [Thermoplasmatales archaeon]
YTISDGNGGTDTATVSVTVTPVNDPPSAVDDYVSVNEDSTNNQIDVIANDNDIDGDSLTISNVTQPLHGTTTFTVDYAYYTPDGDYTGSDQFNYTISDGNGGTDAATVYVTVTSVNDPPVANDDNVSVAEDSTDNQLDVLANDIDVDGDSLDITSVSTPTHGTATYTASYVYYTPDPDYTGSDQFSYTISDNNGGTDSATVYVTVTPVNDPPVASDDTATVLEDSTNNQIDVLANDNDPDGDTLNITGVTVPLHGTTTYNASFAFYTPDANYTGPDQFSYTISDGNGGTDTATVTVTVGGVNDPPTANDDTATVLEDSVNNQIDVLANDNDPDGDTLSITGVTVPLHGTATYTASFVFYTPDPDYNGPDSFNYSITDNNGETDTATVSITITPINDPPYVPSNPNPTHGEKSAPINTLLNWTSIDPDGDNVTHDVYFGIINPPPKIISNQTATIYNPGTLAYNRTYYWRIVSFDINGASTSGPIWNFTTEGENDWKCRLFFNQLGGVNDTIYFGEKGVASDGLDNYDIPKSLPSTAPYIYARFVTSFPDPYDELETEYKHYPGDYKEWYISIHSSSLMNITISWNSSDLINSEYLTIILENSASGEEIDMISNENYTFISQAWTDYYFRIICYTELTIQITNLMSTWNLVSLPFNQSVSKSDLMVRYNNNNYTWQDAVNNTIILGFFYNWNRSAPQHYELTDILEPGYGYWIYAFYDCELWAEGVSIANNGDTITDLRTIWNLFGLPDDNSMLKEDILVNYNGVDYSWNDSTTNNNPTGGPIIIGFLYNWNRSIPQHYELSDVINPGFAYWIYAYYECTLKMGVP